jgi:cytochrome b561
VALVLVQVATGLSWTQFDEESTARSVLFRIHMFSGMAILILMVVRLAWRRTSPWRPLPQDVPQGARVLARVNHVLLLWRIDPTAAPGPPDHFPARGQ